jgi:uncharacterized membrane protein
MHLSPQQILIIALIAAVGCGLMAGIFFAFSNFLMKALLSLPTESGVRTMQSITAFLQNPVFLALFLGTNLASAILVVTAVFRLTEPGVEFQLAGGLLCLVGTFAVTLLVNVPLNNRLTHIHPASDEMTRFWPNYVSRWSKWNHVRTITAMAATALLVVAIDQARAGAI